jgi:hypothetical protein
MIGGGGWRGKLVMGMESEVAWIKYLFQERYIICSEYEKLRGQIHDFMFFNIEIGLRPDICEEISGITQYGNWYMATRRDITITTYQVKIVITKVSGEEPEKFKVVDVVMKPLGKAHITLKPFDPSVVRRIIDFAETLNATTFYADKVEVGHDGYLLHVVKSERLKRGRYKNTEGFIHFDLNGNLVSTPFNIQRSITSFT